MVVERYLRVEKDKIKPKITLRPKKSSRPNTPKKAKKVPKFIVITK